MLGVGYHATLASRMLLLYKKKSLGLCKNV